MALDYQLINNRGYFRLISHLEPGFITQSHCHFSDVRMLGKYDAIAKCIHTLTGSNICVMLPPNNFFFTLFGKIHKQYKTYLQYIICFSNFVLFFEEIKINGEKKGKRRRWCMVLKNQKPRVLRRNGANWIDD